MDTLLTRKLNCCGYAVPIRRIIRWVWAAVALAVVFTLPLTIWEFRNEGYSAHYQAWFVAGLFVMLAIPVTVYEVSLHYVYFTKPHLQRHVIRILLMVPVHAIASWISLRFISPHIWLAAIRDCYEAFVIYSFFMYLVNYLQEVLPDGRMEAFFADLGQVGHLFPMSLAPQWFAPIPGTDYLKWTKRRVMAYVVVRPILTLVAITAMVFKVYGEGHMSLHGVYAYVAFTNTITQALALYALILFYHTTRHELAPIRPLAKFVCIKAIVFFTFWQGVAISILAAVGAVNPTSSWNTYDARDVANGLQDFLVCIEMLVAAVAHAFVFSPRDYYTDTPPPNRGLLGNIREMLDWGDVWEDATRNVADYAQETQREITNSLRVFGKQVGRGVKAAVAMPVTVMRGVLPNQGYHGAGFRSVPNYDDAMEQRGLTAPEDEGEVRGDASGPGTPRERSESAGRAGGEASTRRGASQSGALSAGSARSRGRSGPSDGRSDEGQDRTGEWDAEQGGGRKGAGAAGVAGLRGRGAGRLGEGSRGGLGPKRGRQWGAEGADVDGRHRPLMGSTDGLEPVVPQDNSSARGEGLSGQPGLVDGAGRGAAGVAGAAGLSQPDARQDAPEWLRSSGGTPRPASAQGLLSLSPKKAPE